MTNLINKKRNEGFTIIEVVLVLAIAGLIFLIVFTALPQLQRSRRDTQRKNDASRLVAAVTQLQSNTGGLNVPANVAGFPAGFIADYLDDFNDPSGSAYVMLDSPTSTPTDGELVYSNNSRCDGAGMIAATGAANFAVTMNLEQGTYCQDNQ